MARRAIDHLQGSSIRTAVRRVAGDTSAEHMDELAVEEPLQISIAWPGEERTVAVTMRTPGHDADLAVGFLLGEGILDQRSEIKDVHVGLGADEANQVCVELAGSPASDALESLERNFYVTSSCGVCGKASIQAVQLQSGFSEANENFCVSPSVLKQLPGQLLRQQALFADTGSIHAAAFFSCDGLAADVFEDVGRHNALDKLIGNAHRAGALPAVGRGVMVSGRASFELVQKAHMARVPMLVAVGAPSSLAVDFAWEVDMTLVGFAREDRFNVYSGPDRVGGLS